MSLTPEELLAIASRYWRADDADDSTPGASPEARRFFELWERELKRMEEWRALVRELSLDLPGFTLRNITSPSDSCFRCAAYPPGGAPFAWVVVGCMSIMAPLSIVYGVRYEYAGEEVSRATVLLEPLPPPMREAAAAVSRGLEATFGTPPLSRELAETPVPLFVQLKEPPHTTLFHALFTNEPQSVP